MMISYFQNLKIYLPPPNSVQILHPLPFVIRCQQVLAWLDVQSKESSLFLDAIDLCDAYSILTAPQRRFKVVVFPFHLSLRVSNCLGFPNHLITPESTKARPQIAVKKKCSRRHAASQLSTSSVQVWVISSYFPLNLSKIVVSQVKLSFRSCLFSSRLFGMIRFHFQLRNDIAFYRSSAKEDTDDER